MKRKRKTTHEGNLDRVARIEGQVSGIRCMTEEGAYCVDIVMQIQASMPPFSASATGFCTSTWSTASPMPRLRTRVGTRTSKWQRS